MLGREVVKCQFLSSWVLVGVAATSAASDKTLLYVYKEYSH